MSLDWQQRTFIFVEIKTRFVPLTIGQRIHLEGLVKAIRKGGKTAYAILATHVTPLTEDVHVAQCDTTSIWDGNTWDVTDTKETLSVTLDRLYKDHLEEYPRK